MKRFRLSVLLLSLLVTAGLSASPASAVPGGNAGVDEYTESIPGAGGNKASSGDGGSPTSSLPTGIAQQLAGSGSLGEAIARAAVITSPQTKALRRAARKAAAAGSSKSGTSVPSAAAADASGVIDPASALANSDDGSGPLLPILLGLIGLAGIIGIFFVRTRNS